MFISLDFETNSLTSNRKRSDSSDSDHTPRGRGRSSSEIGHGPAQTTTHGFDLTPSTKKYMIQFPTGDSTPPAQGAPTTSNQGGGRSRLEPIWSPTHQIETPKWDNSQASFPVGRTSNQQPVSGSSRPAAQLPVSDPSRSGRPQQATSDSRQEGSSSSRKQASNAVVRPKKSSRGGSTGWVKTPNLTGGRRPGL